MSEQDFIKETQEWLKPFGYTVHSYSPDRSFVTMINNDDEYYNWQDFPSIDCWDKNGERGCRLQYNGLKMFISLQSGDLQYKHADIKRFIHVFVRYVKAMNSINPFE